jgi:putative lipoprotein
MRTVTTAALLACIAIPAASGCARRALRHELQERREAAADMPLRGTEWTCASVNAEAVLDGAAPTLTISADGKVSGNSGVNRFGGSIEESGKALRFSQLSSTRMAGPPDRMKLEASFLSALERTRSFRVDGTLLTLLDQDASVVATFLGQAPAPAPAK